MSKQFGKILSYVLLFLLLLKTACTSRETKYEYFENGNIKSTIEFKDKKKDGKETQYFLSGDISSITEWENGKKNGSFKKFFENGHLGVAINYLNDKRVGESLIYFDNGKIFQHQFFDSLGQLLDYHEFDMEGHRSNKMDVIFFPETDSVNLGKDFSLSFSIGNVSDYRYFKGSFIMTSDFRYDGDMNPVAVSDTLKIIYSTNNVYDLSLNFDSSGYNFLRGQIVVEVNKDSVGVFFIQRRFKVN